MSREEFMSEKEHASMKTLKPSDSGDFELKILPKGKNLGEDKLRDLMFVEPYKPAVKHLTVEEAVIPAISGGQSVKSHGGLQNTPAAPKKPDGLMK